MISAPRPENEARRLECLQQCALLDTEAEPGYDDLTGLASFICGTPIALISLVDADRQWFKSKVGLEVAETPRDIAFCAHTILNPEMPLVVPDATLDIRFATNPLVTSEPHFRFYAGVPLVKDGCAIGALCVKDFVPRELSASQLYALCALGRQVMTLVELRCNLAQQQRIHDEHLQFYEKLRLLESAVQNTNDVIVITKVVPGHLQELRTVYVNDAWTRLTGYTREEIINQTPYILHGPMTHPETLITVAQKLISGEAINTEILHYRKDGTTFWSDLNIQPFVDESGRNSHYITVIRDITARKQAEERNRIIVETALDAVITIDAQSCVIDWNPQAETIFGWARDAALGNPLEELIIPHRLREAHVAGLRHFFATAEGPVLRRRVELTALHRNGREFPIEMTATPIRQGDSYVFTAFVRDITERKLAHDLLDARVKERTAELQASEARLSMALRSARMGYFDFDFATNRAIMSEGHYALLGLSSEIGEIDASLFFDRVHPDDLERLKQEVDRAAAEQREYSHEHRIVRPDGVVRWIAGYGKCRCDEGGVARQMTGVIMDITDRKQAEEERRRLEAQVLHNEKLASIGRLVAGVAHEINNPLATISVNAQLLLLHPDEKIQKRGETIRRMTDRATRIARSLLTFARGGEDDKRSEALNSVVEETLQLCGYKLKQADVELELKLDPHLRAVRGNANQIQQILMNLLNNAEHALRQRTDGDRRVCLISGSVRDSQGTDRAFVSVADNGCGIPPDVLRRIFDPFFTTKDIGEGTGLGLSICHGIAEAHGGALTVESQVGVGTTFTLTLPFCQPAADAA